ncbi:MAG: peptidylprolyl isomerase [Sedimentisphaerales bacterium]|nr:peptidylprolyl isomerase [Sedimentisphaerales bacterium]
MSNFLTKLTLLIIIMVSLTVCSLSCNKKSSEQADTSKSQSGQDKIETKNETKLETADVSESEQPLSNIAVTVNGVDIAEEEIQKLLQPQLDRMEMQNQQIPPALKQTLEKQMRQQILQQMINMQLLEQKAKEDHIVVTDDELNQQITRIASSQNPPLTIEQLEEIVAKQGLTFEQWKNEIRKQLVPLKLFKNEFPEGVQITEKDAKKYYDETPKEFETKEQVRASHILIKPETEADSTEATPQAKAKAKAKAEDLLKQIKAGADFAALAKANSDCPSSAKGGDLDFFAKGRMVPPFEKAAFAMKTGQVSDIVETSFGYHIIKVTDRKPAATTSFEQAKDDLIRRLTQKQQVALINKYIDSLKATANIVYPPGKEPKPAATPMMVPQPK